MIYLVGFLVWPVEPLDGPALSPTGLAGTLDLDLSTSKQSDESGTAVHLLSVFLYPVMPFSS